MKRILRIAAPLALLLLAPAAARAADVPADAKKFEKTVPFREGAQKIDIRFEDVTIDSVEIKAWPDAEDYAKAEKKPDDTKTMWIVYTYSNGGTRDYKCRYAAMVPDPSGGAPWAQDDSVRTLDRGKTGDTNRFGMKMLTTRYKLARTIKLTFELWKK